MDRQAKKSAKTQAEKEVNAMVEEHPFGPIDNSLIVGYYRRSGFRPARVRICKGKPTVFELPHPQFDDFYKCFESMTDIRSHPSQERLGFQAKLKYSVNTRWLWKSMNKQGFGYQLKFQLSGVPADALNPASWPQAVVEWIDQYNESVRYSCKVLQSHWKQLLQIQEMKKLLDRFPEAKKVSVRVTPNCLVVWLGDQLYERLTRLNPFNDPERSIMTLPGCILDERCLSILDLGNSSLKMQFFKSISRLLIGTTTALQNLAASDVSSISQRLGELNQMVSAIEFLLLKPFYEHESFHFVPLKTVTQMVKMVQEQIQSILEGNHTLISNLESCVMMLFLSAKNLIDLDADTILKYVRPRLESGDPETVAHERWLYSITALGFDSLLEKLLGHCDILGVPEHLMLSPEASNDPKFVGHTRRFTYNIQDNEVIIAQVDNVSEAPSVSIPIPSAFRKWWSARVITILFERDTLVCHPSYGVKGGVLDVSAALRVSQKKSKQANTKYWIPFDISQIAAGSYWAVRNPPMIFDQSLFVSISHLQKLNIGFWSWKEQPKARNWVVQRFENPFKIDERNTQASIPMRWRGGQLLVLINQTAFLEQDKTLTQLVVFWKNYKSDAPEFWFDQNVHLLKNGADGWNTFTWIEKRRRLFLLASTFMFCNSSLHYLQDRKFVRIADAFGQAPGFARLLKSSQRGLDITRFGIPGFGVGLAQHMKRVSQDNRTARLLVSIITVRF